MHPTELRTATPSWHPSDGDLAALVHDGWSADARAARTAVTAHVAACATCLDRVATLRQEDAETAAALSLLDHPAPRRTADDVLTEARRRARPTPRAWRIAAAIGLTVAGAAAALPSSPLRRLWTRPAAPAAPSTAPTTAVSPATPAAARVAPTGAGIAVLAGERLEVEFRRPGAGRVEIRLVDGPQLSLVPQGADVGFTVRPERVAVDDTTGRASFVLLVPRAVRHLRVRVGDAVVFRRDGSDIVTAARRDTIAGAYVLDLRTPRP